MPTEKLNLKICNWKRNDNCLICDTDDITKKIIVRLEQFEKWLLKNDYLYYEDHDYSTGTYISNARTISINEYLDSVPKCIIIEDLNNFFLC